MRGQLVGRAVEQAARARPGTSRPPTARPRAASRRPPPRVTTAPAGDGTGRSCTGTDTLAVVPQLTMGRSSEAPEPSTSHWRSPAPMTTGMPGRSPSSAPGTGLELADHGVGRHDARELAQRRAGQLAHGVAVEVVEPAARGEGGVGHHLVGHAVDDEVARATGSGRAASRRSGSCSASQASLAATAPASSGIPVRARLMSSPPMRSASARASAAARWSDHRMPLPIGSPCARHRHEGLAGARARDDVDLAEAPAAPGPGPRRRR